MDEETFRYRIRFDDLPLLPAAPSELDSLAELADLLARRLRAAGP